VGGLSFSPDGTTLASGCWDRTVKLWDTVTGRELRTLYGHKNWVNSVAFSPDGNTLASGDADGRILLWQAATASQIAQTEDSKLLKRVLQMQQAEKVDKPLLAQFLERYPDDTDVKQRYQKALPAPQLQAAREALARKDYDKAATSFLAIYHDTENAEDCRSAACALLAAGNVEGYRALCRELLEKYGKGAAADGVLENLHIASWVLTLIPEGTSGQVGGSGPEMTVRLDKKVVDSEPQVWYYQTCYANALYRAGRYAEAARKMEQVEQEFLQKRALNRRHPGVAYMSALAHYRMGDIAKARSLLALADAESKRPSQVDEDWRWGVELRLHQKEAYAVIDKGQ
jgi:WD domain, G-beta repeat